MLKIVYCFFYSDRRLCFDIVFLYYYLIILYYIIHLHLYLMLLEKMILRCNIVFLLIYSRGLLSNCSQAIYLL